MGVRHRELNRFDRGFVRGLVTVEDRYLRDYHASGRMIEGSSAESMWLSIQFDLIEAGVDA